VSRLDTRGTPQTEIADVVLCHHLVYNVSDLAGFVAELASHARARVVVEMTTVHPMAWMTPYWEALHGLTSRIARPLKTPSRC
jgi:hypothetical protein